MSLLKELELKMYRNEGNVYTSFEKYTAKFLLKKSYADFVLRDVCKKVSYLGISDFKRNHRLRVYRNIIKECDLSLSLEKLFLGAPSDVAEFICCHYQYQYYQLQKEVKTSMKKENPYKSEVSCLRAIRQSIKKEENYYIEPIWKVHLSNFNLVNLNPQEKINLFGEVILKYEQIGKIDAKSGIECREENAVASELDPYFQIPGFILSMSKDLRKHLYDYYQSGYYGQKLEHKMMIKK